MKRIAFVILFLFLPSPLAGQSHRETVVEVKRQVVAQGISISGPCGAFQITKRVAWVLRSEGYGLIAKGGNHCEGYSTDAVILPSGVHYDILGDSGGTNSPEWNLVVNEHTGEPYLRPGDYRAPFDPEPAGPTPVPVPEPVPPVPTPEPPADEQLDRIESKLDQHIASTEEFQSNVGSEWRAVKNFIKDKGLYILGALLGGKYLFGNN